MEASELLEKVMRAPMERNAFEVMRKDQAARFMHGITLVSVLRLARCKVQRVSTSLIRSL